MKFECTAGENKCGFQSRYRPAQSKPSITPANKRYYKLHNGDILDIDSKTILDRQALEVLLNE